MTAPPVLVAGDVRAEVLLGEPDLGHLLTGAAARAVLDATPPRVAGAAARTAVWLASLGLPVRLAGRVGADPAGAMLREQLQARGVELALVTDPRLPTGLDVAVGTPEGGAERLDGPASAAQLTEQDLPEALLDGVAHLHLAGMAALSPDGRPAGAAAVQAARRVGLTVSAQTPVLAAIEAVEPDVARPQLGGLDLLITGAAEAFALVEDVVARASDTRPEGTAVLLCRTIPEVVVTAGSAGAVWAGRRGEPVRVPAEAVPSGELVDLDGVREAFAAGFLAAWLLDVSPAQALRSGARVAASALRTPGPLPAG